MIVLRRVVLVFALALLLAVSLPAANVFALTRAEVIKRAQTWTNSGVPYSQSRRHLGYRSDCSGFVSYALRLSMPGANTSSLPGVTFAISKEELQPGDLLLDAGEHVVIFGGWANTAHTSYICYEQSRSAGSVCRITPYPYWNGSYIPRRCIGISGSAAGVSRGIPRKPYHKVRNKKQYSRNYYYGKSRLKR